MENNMKLRILSSVILLLVLAIVLYIGNYAVFATILVVTALEYKEWSEMIQDQSKFVQVLVLFVIIFPNTSLICIYTNSIKVFIWLVISVVSNDVMAYFIGRSIGGYKLFEKISPNKTWSGFFGGILGSFLCGGLFVIFSGLSINFAFLSIIIAVLGTLGDLFESFIKRCCRVKDSGSLIPGHGGILDRVDGFIFTAPFVLYILL